MIIHAIVVEVLHDLLLKAKRLELRAGVEGVVDHATRTDIAQLRANECATFTWLHVLEFNDDPEFVLIFDAHSVTEISGRNCHGDPRFLLVISA